MKERIQNIIFAILFSALLYGWVIRIVLQQDYAHASDESCDPDVDTMFCDNFAYQNSLILILPSDWEHCTDSWDGWFTCYNSETNKVRWYFYKKPLKMDYEEVYHSRYHDVFDK